jgi:tyrosyl-tRNA synthetase
MFGKIMSLPDSLMEMYYTLLTDLPMPEIRQQIQSSPRDAKVRLAKHLIGWLHSPQSADSAEQEFKKVFSEHGVPDMMPQVSVGAGPHKIAPLLVKAGLASSNSEAIRKVKEGAVSIDGEKVTDYQKELTLAGAAVLKLGRKFARVSPA